MMLSSYRTNSVFEISVRRNAEGIGSKFLHDVVLEKGEGDGTEVELLGIEGDFTLDVMKPLPPKVLLQEVPLQLLRAPFFS